MSIRTVLALAVMLICAAAAAAQPAPFAFGGPQADVGVAVDALADGTFAIGGTTFGGYDPDPSGADATVPGGGAQDGFAAVYGPDGAFRFAVPIGPPGPSAADAVFDVALGSDGSLIVVGQVGETVDLDPGPGVATVEAPGLAVHVFLAAYSASGEFRWGFALPGLDFSLGAYVDVGEDGAVYLAASASSPTDLDPGPGETIVDGFRSATLASYTASGDFRWGFALEGAQCRARGLSVAGERVALTGNLISGAVDVDPGPAERLLEDPDNRPSAWLTATYTTDGELASAFVVGGSNFGGVQGVALGDAGGVALVGSIDRAADFDPGPGTRTIEDTGGSNGTGVVASYEADGTLRFAYGLGSALPRGVSVEGDRLSWTGFFGEAFDADPGPATRIVTPEAGLDIVTVGLTPAGGFRWASPITGSGTGDNGLAVALASGRTYITGRFSDTVDADPGPATVELASGGRFDYDVLAVAYDDRGDLAALPTAAEPPAVSLALSVAPNPSASGAAVVRVEHARGPLRLSVYDALGRLVATPQVGRALPPLAPGVYMIRAETAAGVASARFIVAR